MFDWNVVEQAIKRSHPTSRIYVGCDSKRKGESITYATVIIIHHCGNAGATLFKHIDVEPAYLQAKEGVRSRLMNEVYKAGEVAYKVKEWVGNRRFEVHVDINPDPRHKSSVAYQEAKGTILGYVGIEPIFKPHAFAASCAADYDAVRKAEKMSFRKERRRTQRRATRAAKRQKTS